MGAVCSGLLQKVANREAFEKRQAGPTLRRFFGAYRNQDYWAVYRRFRAIDDGNGYVSYEELLQCVNLAEYQSLFVWETFSQQNELINAREFMTVICVFSSAKLEEKGKFLQALFDDSHTGLNLASEIVSVFHTVLAVLTECTGIPVKVREVKEHIKSVIPDLLPNAWTEALERAHGKSEAAFNNERFIGQIEMDMLVPSLMAIYETLPIAGPPPIGACPPPPPDWATPSSLEKGQAKVQDKKTAPAQGASVKALSKAELSHLAWIAKMDDEEDEEGKENLQSNGRQGMAATTGGIEERASVDASAKGWMVIYGTEFSTVAKDLPKFRHLFMRSVSSALGIPRGCVEVVNITRGSVVIEFILHPSGRGNDTRDGETLKQALSQQLSVSHSALRKGAFKDYVTTAELVERPQRNRPATSNAALSAPSNAAPVEASSQSARRRDQEVQTELVEQDDQMKEVLQDLEATEAEARQWQKRAEEAEAARDAALKELAELRGNSAA